MKGTCRIQYANVDNKVKWFLDWKLDYFVGSANSVFSLLTSTSVLFPHPSVTDKMPYTPRPRRNRVLNFHSKC